MVAEVQPTGAIHRTFLEKAGGKFVGGKIGGDSAKMMLGRCGGGAVRLREGFGPLIVAEGIETALSLAQMHKEHDPSVWAALSTSGVRGLELPIEPGELFVAPDAEPAGRSAAEALAERATTSGWLVSIMDPGGTGGRNWNDVLIEGRAAA